MCVRYAYTHYQRASRPCADEKTDRIFFENRIPEPENFDGAETETARTDLVDREPTVTAWL